MEFEFYCPVKIVVGRSAADKLSYILGEHLGVKRALLITDRGIEQAGLLKLFQELVRDVSFEVFSEVPPDSSLEVVNNAYDTFRSRGCDGLVALGGGSVLDTAKGVCLLASSGAGDVSSIQGVDTVRDRVVPFVAVPTTCGTGSEVSRVAVIEDRASGKKLAFASDAIFPHVAVVDGRFVDTLPPSLLAATSMDALTHAIEAYTCLQKNPISDGFALVALRIIVSQIFRALEGDEEARLLMLVASTVAGLAFSNSMVGMVHAIAHGVGGVAGVAHGVANAILLPHVMRFNSSKSDRMAELYNELFRYAVLFIPDVAGKNLISLVEHLLGRLSELAGIPVRLRDAGVRREQFSEIASRAVLDGASVFNPVSFDEEDVLRILEEAY